MGNPSSSPAGAASFPAVPSRMAPWRYGLAAARANAVPAACIAALGVLILVGYYRHPPTHELLERVADLKRRWGLAYSFVSTAIFGGLLPVLVQHLLPRAWLPRRERLGHLPFFLLFWGYKGMETDLFYRLQGRLFGDAASPGVVLTKLFVDMAFFTTLWAVPSIVLAYAWKDAGFSIRRLRAGLDPTARRWYAHRVLPVLIPNTALWLPAVAILYSLPGALQLPFQNLVQLLSTLIATFVLASHAVHPRDGSAR